MKWLASVLCCLSSHFVLIVGKDIGHFWQVSDFHYDANYSITGNPLQMCHRDLDDANSTLGSYGNYLCDSPWKLVTAAIQGMKTIHGDPDFIVWTGDSVPHVNNSDLNPMKVYRLIGNVTEALVEVFPTTTIYPVLGNHDPYPSSQMPFATDKTRYYHDILNESGWDALLQKDQAEQFRKGGYYSVDLKNTNKGNSTSKVRLIGLNTNLYYDQDRLTNDVDDPAGQMEFLRSEFEAARKRNQKVLIVSHIPPGMFELVPNLMWFYKDFNEKYLQLIEDHADIISGQLYGHEHTDSFRLFYSKDGKPVSSLFLCPAVTPWKSTLPGVGANNPSIRLFQYDRENGELLKIQQYFLNLTAANVAQETKLDWKLEYDTEKDFGLDNLRPEKIRDLVNLLYNRAREFKLYLKYNSVQYSPNPVCNDTCFLQHICAITKLRPDDYIQCLKQGKTTSSPPHSTTHHHRHHTTPAYQDFPYYMYYIIGVLAVIVFVVFLIVAFLCIHRRKRVVPPRYSKFGSLSVNSV